MGTSYTTIIHLSQLMTNIDTVLLNSRIYLNFISFPLTWSRIPSKTHIKSGNHVSFRLLWLWQSHKTSLVFDDFDVLWSTAQKHSRTSFYLTGAKGFGEEDQRWVTFSSHQGYALPTRISLISSPHHLVKVAFPRFLLVNFYFYFPTFHTILFRRKSTCTAHT